MELLLLLLQGSPDEHVPEVGKLAVLLVLHLHQSPLGLAAQYLLATNAVDVVTSNHSKGDQVLQPHTYVCAHTQSNST